MMTIDFDGILTLFYLVHQKLASQFRKRKPQGYNRIHAYNRNIQVILIRSYSIQT